MRVMMTPPRPHDAPEHSQDVPDDANIATSHGRTANTSAASAPSSSPPTRLLSGILLCAGIGVAATLIGRQFPLLGAPIAGLLLGLLVGNVFTLPAHTEAGIQWSVKKLLKWAIMGLGLRLPLQQLWTVGRESLSITLITLSLAFLVAFLANKWLKLSRPLSLLIGAGTAICGGSAIAAVAPIVKPKKQELALALTTIFLFNLVAVFLFPFRSEEHTSELQSRGHLVCRLLLEKQEKHQSS